MPIGRIAEFAIGSEITVHGINYFNVHVQISSLPFGKVSIITSKIGRESRASKRLHIKNFRGDYHCLSMAKIS